MTKSKILVPIMPTQNDLSNASEVFSFANKLKAEIELFSVIEESHFDEASRDMDVPIFDSLEIVKNNEEERLNKLANAIEKDYSDLIIKTRVETGKAQEHVLEQTQFHDLVAIDPTRKGKKRLAEAGSITRSLLRHSQTPVWCYGQYGAEIPKRIVAAIDLRDDEESKTLNNEVIRSAISFAKSANAELHILHAWNLPGEGFIRTWERKAELEIAQMAETEKSLKLEKIQKYIEQYDYDRIQISLVEGRPKDVITNYIGNNHIDLLLMGTFARSNLAGMLLGNTAEVTLDLVNCSLITFKPKRIS